MQQNPDTLPLNKISELLHWNNHIINYNNNSYLLVDDYYTTTSEQRCRSPKFTTQQSLLYKSKMVHVTKVIIPINSFRKYYISYH